MEMAIAALGKVFAGMGGAAAGGLQMAGAGAALGGAFPAAPGMAAGGLSALQGVMTAVSVLGAIGQGLSAASESREMAAQAELQAGQEKVAGLQRQNQIRRSLAQVLGENDVAFAAAGIDISHGIADQARSTAHKRAAQEISIDRQDADFRAAMHRMRASGYRRRARGQVGGALLGALGSGANYAIDLVGRG